MSNVELVFFSDISDEESSQTRTLSTFILIRELNRQIFRTNLTHLRWVYNGDLRS